MNELDFRRQVIDLANLYGWDHVGFRPAKTEDGWRTPVTGTLGKGWPDLTLVRTRDRRLIFAELKSNAGKTSVDQDFVLSTLDELGHCMCGSLDCLQRQHGPRVEVHVWRPSDFDRVREILR